MLFAKMARYLKETAMDVKKASSGNGLLDDWFVVDNTPVSPQERTTKMITYLRSLFFNLTPYEIIRSSLSHCTDLPQLKNPIFLLSFTEGRKYRVSLDEKELIPSPFYTDLKEEMKEIRLAQGATLENKKCFVARYVQEIDDQCNDVCAAFFKEGGMQEESVEEGENRRRSILAEGPKNELYTLDSLCLKFHGLRSAIDAWNSQYAQ